MPKVKVQPLDKSGRFSGRAVLLLAALLVFPAMATFRLMDQFDERWVLGYLSLISAATYLLYRHDKKQAQAGRWRTPESRLHLAELLGGWPGAYLAQQVLRHKSSKTSYQLAFWAIVVFHQLLAFDFVMHWRYFGRLLSVLHS